MKANANQKHTKLDNKAFILFVLLLSYLVNFTACSFFDFKKQFSLTQEVNLKIKELILKKLTSEQFPQKMILTWSFCGAAWLMMWQNFRRISEISLLALPWVRVISRSKGFLWLIDLEISIFLEQIILNETG